MPSFRTIDISDPRFEAEGLRHVTVKSPSLRGRADLTVWAPAGVRPVALVVLLHGVYGSHWCWALKGGAHRTAGRLIDAGVVPPLALAMPSDGLRGDGTAYMRHGDGTDYERWILDEVPLAARAALPSLDAAAPLCLAGLSMGGFGALRLGARHATRVRAVSGHSSMTHFDQMARFVEEDPVSFGTSVAEASALDAIIAAGAHLPRLRFDCGLDDELLELNRELHRALEARAIDHTYEEFPGGHTWPYWEAHLDDTLRFFGEALRS